MKAHKVAEALRNLADKFEKGFSKEDKEYELQIVLIDYINNDNIRMPALEYTSSLGTSLLHND